MIPNEPGEELDVYIANEVLGWKLKSTGASSWSIQVDGAECQCWYDGEGKRMHASYFQPSRDDGHAVEVLKHFAAKGYDVRLEASNLPGRWRCRMGSIGIPEGGPTIALAICREALRLRQSGESATLG